MTTVDTWTQFCDKRMLFFFLADCCCYELTATKCIVCIGEIKEMDDDVVVGRLLEGESMFLEYELHAAPLPIVEFRTDKANEKKIFVVPGLSMNPAIIL